LIEGRKGIKVLRKIRENIELSTEEKEAILKEIYSKRDKREISMIKSDFPLSNSLRSDDPLPSNFA
jgi:hypothetical protein